MWKRNYKTAERMIKILMANKGYPLNEASEIVQRIFDDTRDGDNLKHRLDRVLSKSEYDAMVGGLV